MRRAFLFLSLVFFRAFVERERERERESIRTRRREETTGWNVKRARAVDAIFFFRRAVNWKDSNFELDDEFGPNAFVWKRRQTTNTNTHVQFLSLSLSRARACLKNAFFFFAKTVQHECIPQAILGMDVLCQAKSGMGKTAVFVITVLQQLDPTPNEVGAVILCHTRELAYQISHEMTRFSAHMPSVKAAVIYGGVNIKTQREELKANMPNVIVATPGRLKVLVQEGTISLKKCAHFILDECDKCLEKLDMRADVQEIFKMTPHDKQVMMFTATLSKELRPVCKKFMNDPMEIFVDDETKLTLHGLVQHYVKLEEQEKNRKLTDLLDALQFNQVVIFVSSVARCTALDRLMQECNFPSIAISRAMSQEERLLRYQSFKDGNKRILVATDLVARGIDIERVNIVINYDMPADADTYLHRVGRAGRFGTKGLAISFVSSSEDSDVLSKVHERFEVSIDGLPDEIDTSSYMPS